MAENPIDTFVEQTESEKTVPELSVTIMTINMNGEGSANDRRKLISEITSEVKAHVIFSQELPGRFKEEVVKKCGTGGYNFHCTGNEAAVIWREAYFRGDPVRGTYCSIAEIVEKLQRDRTDIDVSEVRTRTAMVKLTRCVTSTGTEASFLAVSWHGPWKGSPKQEQFNGLICFVHEVCKKEKLSKFIIGGDFNLTTLGVDLKQNKDLVNVAYYELITQDKNKLQKSRGRRFVPYKDNFVFTQTGDITVSEVKALQLTDSKVLDHVPVVGVLKL